LSGISRSWRNNHQYNRKLKNDVASWRRRNMQTMRRNLVKATESAKSENAKKGGIQRYRKPEENDG